MFGQVADHRLDQDKAPPAEVDAVADRVLLQPVRRLWKVEVVVAEVADYAQVRVLVEQETEVAHVGHLGMGREEVVERAALEHRFQLSPHDRQADGGAAVHQQLSLIHI